MENMMLDKSAAKLDLMDRYAVGVRTVCAWSTLCVRVCTCVCLCVYVLCVCVGALIALCVCFHLNQS